MKYLAHCLASSGQEIESARLNLLLGINRAGCQVEIVVKGLRGVACATGEKAIPANGLVSSCPFDSTTVA